MGGRRCKEIDILNSGLLVGRFQPCHLGHIAAVKFALKKVKFLYICVGSADKSHEPRNPFTAGERVRMLKLALEGAGLSCESWMPIPLPDAPSHAVWVSYVNMLVPEYKVVFSNDNLTRLLFLERGVKVLRTPLFHRKKYSATKIRETIVEGGDWAELVPKEVAKFIEDIGGVSRLVALTARANKAARNQGSNKDN